MKTAGLVAVIAAVAVLPAMSALAEMPKPDTLVRIQAFMPERTEDWDTGGGVELQARFWSSDSFGTALCLGFNSWTATSEFSESSDDIGSINTSIYGDVTRIPVGVSALYRRNMSGRTVLVFEAGVRYVFTRSDIYAETVTEDAGGTSYLKDKILTDNAFVGILGLNVETEMIDGMSLHLGFGYQFDLTRSHETFRGEDMGTTSFNSPMVNVGVTWMF